MSTQNFCTEFYLPILFTFLYNLNKKIIKINLTKHLISKFSKKKQNKKYKYI